MDGGMNERMKGRRRVDGWRLEKWAAAGGRLHGGALHGERGWRSRDRGIDGRLMEGSLVGHGRRLEEERVGRRVDGSMVVERRMDSRELEEDN